MDELFLAFLTCFNSQIFVKMFRIVSNFVNFFFFFFRALDEFLWASFPRGVIDWKGCQIIMQMLKLLTSTIFKIFLSFLWAFSLSLINWKYMDCFCRCSLVSTIFSLYFWALDELSSFFTYRAVMAWKKCLMDC